MAIYIVTTSNWNSAAFWSGITETGTGHTLDFSALDATYSVTVDQTTGVFSIVNGATTYTIGEAGVTGVNANFGGSTLLDYFTIISGAQSGDRVTGSAEDELFDGNSGDDRMEGMAGNDTFYGNGGADQMDGGDGADILYGGSGGDELYGGTGADQLFGESDNDTIDAGSGDDFANGGAGADLIFGGDGADHLEGGYEDASADTIYAGTGNDLVFGGGGDDSIFGEAGLDYLDGQAGNDYIDGGSENDRILGDLGSDTIFGGGNYDTLTGGEGADLINGGSDGDHIYGNAGDTIDGGETGDDFDTLYVSYVDFITYSTAESGTVTFNSGDTLTFTGIEQVVNLSNDGIVQGTAGGDQIGQFYFDADGDWVDNGDAIGEGDGDSIRAGDGNDTVWSNDGNDTVHGEGGNDQINLGGGNNVAFGGAGADTINGEWQNDTISGDDFIASGPNLIVNGSFEDTTGMTTTGWGFSGAGAAPGWTDANGFPIEFHNDGRGGLTATDGSNWLDLEGNPGQQSTVSQTVAGVQDGQVYVLSFDAADLSNINDGTTQDNQLQVIWNGDVVGTIDASDGSWRNYEFHLIGGSGNGSNTLVFQGLGDVSGIGASIDNVQLYEGLEAAGDADSIVGGDGDDDIMTGAGDDTILAGGGDDEVVAGSGADSVLGGAGNDMIWGEGGNDILRGGDGNDSMVAGTGNDVLDGGTGSDSLIGGLGQDTLIGGAGGDFLQGNEESDLADYSASDAAVTIVLDGGGAAGFAAGGHAENDTIVGIDEILGSAFNDSLTGYDATHHGTLSNIIDGGAGDDTIDGMGGNDILYGGTGNDSILGGAGDDSIFGGAGDDVLIGGVSSPISPTFSGDFNNLATDPGVTTSGVGTNPSPSQWRFETNQEGSIAFDPDQGGADIGGVASIDTSFLFDTGSGQGSLSWSFGDPATMAANPGQGLSSGLTIEAVTITGSNNDVFVFKWNGAVISTQSTGANDIAIFNATNATFSISETGLVTLNILNYTQPTYTAQIPGTEWQDADTSDYQFVAGSDFTGWNYIQDVEFSGTTQQVEDDDVIDGGAGDDLINGGVGDDTLSGGAGNDTIYGGDGADSLLGGDDLDTIYGDAGDDRLEGGEGDDLLLGGIGNDTISGDGGNDWVQGGFGTDSLSGGLGNDTLYGDGDNDVLEGGDGVDVLSGGDGNDTLYGDGDGDLLQGGTGLDLLLGGLGNDTLYGDGDDDRLEGGDGVDVLSGGDGNDTLYGEAGGDLLQGATGLDLLLGGLGNDTLYGGGDDDRLEGGDGIDVLVGNTGNDTLIGNEGGDSLNGGDGDDLIIGDGAASTPGGTFGLFALPSSGTTGIFFNGTFTFDASADSINVQVTDDETAFEDLNSSAGSTLDAGAPQVLTQDITIGSTTYLAGTSIHAIAQSDIVNETTGETGNAWLVQLGPTQAGNVYWSFDIAVNNGDQITWTSSNTPGVQDQIYANTTGLEYIDLVQADGQFLPSNDTLVGGIGNDTLIGGVGDDSLVAGDGADSISGDGGSDWIDAGTGNDTVDAGDGNDQVFAWTGDDSVLGGAGSDTVFGQDGNDTIFGGIGNDYLDGDDAVAGADSIFGEDGDDTIIGDGGNDTLSGGSGNDQIFAGADDDIVMGGTGNDQLYGEGGNDSLDAGAGNDTVLGGDGNDTIIGFEGNDSVLGGAGDDVINTRTSPGTGLPDEGYGAIGNPLYYPADSDAFNDRDTVDGGTGNDSILTGDDNDVILGGDGADTVDAGFDDDEVYGDAGADSLEGNEGNDTISGGADGDVIYGDVSPTNPDYPFYTPYELANDGTDLAPNNNADILSGDGGNDTIYGQDDNDTISGGLGDDEIYGGIDNDSLIGDDGSDTIDGGAGNDYIDGGTGADSLYGGTGDIIGPNLIADGSFEGATPTSWGQVSNLPDWYSWNTASPDLSDDTGYEPTYNTNATPTDGTNYVSLVNNGSGFQEGISQDLATPLVAGTTYTITLDAAAGGYNNTSPLGDNLQILLFGNETAGQVAADNGLPPGVQLLGSADVTTDYNTGTMGTITISFTPTTDIATLSLSLEDPDFSGGFAVLTIDNVSLQENTALPGDNDTIIGGSGDDTIFGQDGDDSLSGGADNDIVDGGIGDDWLSGNLGNDTVRGGDGADSVYGAEGDDVLYGDAGNDSMEGWTGNDTMFGGTGDDYIDGSIGADSLEGGDGNDTLLGGSDVGNDTLRGGLGDDSLSAGGGDDFLDGGDGADILFAADGNDQLDGGAGNDTLDGWTGNDTINAGTGDDQITGGDGNDTFVYAAGDGVDTITDFNFGNTGTLNDGDITNNDRIDLSAFYDDIWELTADFNDDGILNQSNSTLLGGTVDYSNNSSFGGGGLVFSGATGNASSFTVENTGVVCFASGTRILTTEGERLIETLRVGDRIITRDNGVQTLRWIGKRDLSQTDLARNPKLHPIHLSPKLTGGDLPLIVSPQHGVVFNVDGEETLVRAIHLARLQGGAARVMHGCRKVCYFHIMFEDHQIVFANGAPSESFFPGHFALAALESDVRSEIYELFPGLQHHAAEQSYGMQARSFARFSHLPDHLNALRGRSRHRSVPGAAIAAHAHRPNAVTQRQAAS
jgi:Ca2+-binding RTX toxin-like protein